MSSAQSIAIILPAYNEASVIKDTLKSLQAENKRHPQYQFFLIVVDDGSWDDTQNQASKLADIVIRHRLNRGLGAALSTGIEYVRRHHQLAYTVTYDADGQHHPADITNAVKALKSGSQVVIGSRFLNSANHIPQLRRLVLWASNLVTFLFFGIWTTDSQSGFRGFSREAIEVIQLKSNRMEVSSEFFAEIKRNQLIYSEIPIAIKYTDYSLSKGQSNLNSFRVLLKLIYQLFR